MRFPGATSGLAGRGYGVKVFKIRKVKYLITEAMEVIGLRRFQPSIQLNSGEFERMIGAGFNLIDHAAKV